MKTRTQLLAAWNALLGAGSPLVEKAALLPEITELLNSTANNLSDAWHLPVVNLRGTPPSPGFYSVGDRFAVAAGASGAYAGKDHHVATATDSGWDFHKPADGSVLLRLQEPHLLLHMVDGALVSRRLPQDQLFRSTGTTSFSSTSLAEVNALSTFALPIGSRRYRVECTLHVKCASADHGLKVGLVGPSCTHLSVTARIPDTTTSEAVGHKGGYGEVAASSTLPFADAPLQVTLTATLDSPSSAEPITPLLATNDGGSPVQLLPGSTLRITDITE